MAARSCTESRSAGRIVAGALLAGAAALTLAAPGADGAPSGPAEEARTPAASTRRDIDERARLDGVRRDIESLRSRLVATEAREGSVVDALDELDLTQALLAREADALRLEARRAAERSAEAGARAGLLADRAAASGRVLGGWLREVYKAGPVRHVRLIAASASPARFAAAQRAIEAMAASEVRRLEAFRADQARLQAALAALAVEESRVAAFEEGLRFKDEELREQKRRKEMLLADVRRERAVQKVALIELVQVEQRLRDLLESLPSGGARGGPSRGFVRFRGLLDWPVGGSVAVPFGNVRHPRFNTEVPHPGIDIAAAPGQDIRAVHTGRVAFSDWFKGYGQMIVIDHGDGFLSVYGHVAERLAAAGQEVRPGDVIARSGDADAGAPGLYFEIRHDGKPEDPARWLRAAPGAQAARRETARRGPRGPRAAP